MTFLGPENKKGVRIKKYIHLEKTKGLWIQRAVKKHKAGSLHRQLKIPSNEKLPKPLLSKISKAKTGTIVKNPSKVGERRYKVTKLMKQRVILAQNLNKARGG